MGLGFRVFFIDENDSLRRFSLAQYESLFRGDPGVRLPEYAGKRIRCAVVVLNVEGRKPQSIAWIDSLLVPFDHEGKIDVGEMERRARNAWELSAPIAEEENSSGKIIDARRYFEKKRNDQECKWVPTPEIKESIYKAIFGQGSV